MVPVGRFDRVRENEEAVDRFREYLLLERGLAPATIAAYIRVAAEFCAVLDGRRIRLARTRERDIRAFLEDVDGRRRDEGAQR